MILAEKKISVMLIEDHKTMLWGLTRLIESESRKMEVVATASHSDEALALIGQVTPDMILLDLDLDGTCSIELIPALLANGTSQILVLTGTRDQAAIDLAVMRGARGVIRKDASTETLLKAIEKVYQGELWLEQDILCRVFGEIMKPKPVTKRDPEVEKKATLTIKERKIIDTLVKGSGTLNKHIAQQLFISQYTLRNHLTSIYQKLGVRNRLELYVYATKHRLGDEVH